MSSAVVFLLSFLTFLGVAASNINPPIPVPYVEPGVLYELGGTFDESSVTLETVFNPFCPDSEWAWYVLKDVSANYGTDLALVIHIFPMPYLINSYMASQGFYLIEEHVSQAASLEYLEATWRQASNFSNSNTADMTTFQIYDALADLAVEATGIDKDFFIPNLPSYSGDTVRAWKYAVTRKSAGTPWFYVNGVDLTVNSNDVRLTYDDWIEFLDPFFDDTKNRS